MLEPFLKVTLVVDGRIPFLAAIVGEVLNRLCSGEENARGENLQVDFDLSGNPVRIGNSTVEVKWILDNPRRGEVVQFARVEPIAAPKITDIAASAIALSKLYDDAPIRFRYCEIDLTVRGSDKPESVEKQLKGAAVSQCHRPDGIISLDKYRRLTT